MHTKVLLLLWTACLSHSSPITPTLHDKASKVTGIDGRSINPDHVVRPINNMMNRVRTSETAEVIDQLTNQAVGVVGGIMENLGQFVVSTVDQLPNTINDITKTVNTAVTDGGEQVVIMMKGIRQQQQKQADEKAEASNQISSKSDLINFKKDKPYLNTEIQDSLQRIQDNFALTLGRVIAIIYKNADQIDNAVATTLRRVTGLENGKTDSNGLDASTGRSSSAAKSVLKTSTLSEEEIAQLFPDEARR